MLTSNECHNNPAIILIISTVVKLPMAFRCYSKTCIKRPQKPKIGFQNQLSLIAGQKYRRILQGEHSAILSTFIKLPLVIMIFVLSIVEWLSCTGFTVCR